MGVSSVQTIQVSTASGMQTIKVALPSDSQTLSKLPGQGLAKVIISYIQKILNFRDRLKSKHI